MLQPKGAGDVGGEIAFQPRNMQMVTLIIRVNGLYFLWGQALLSNLFVASVLFFGQDWQMANGHAYFNKLFRVLHRPHIIIIIAHYKRKGVLFHWGLSLNRRAREYIKFFQHVCEKNGRALDSNA